jgi:hypothetical protein
MRRLTPILILIVGAFVATSAEARFYIGASYAQTDAEYSLDDPPLPGIEADDSGWKAYVGFDFFRFLGVEASYRELGTFENENREKAYGSDVKVGDVAVRGILPLGEKLGVFVRLGYAYISLDGQFDLDPGDAFNPGGIPGELDGGDWNLYYGGGIDLNLSQHFGIRVEYETYDVEDKLDTWSGGIFIRF